eukprot:TRINITY_DN29513_c0_g1_i1.p1 TRINITY_DN29513_c0_g1~~TRINITY_DN29513_c0_g1_i1.p1  ORF type:complete len:261 (+),score=34.05 TRINITY_DN29513_c0_g1_i1:61-843(+)
MAFGDIVGEVKLPEAGNPTTARLFVGNLLAAESAELYNTVGITHVLTAAGRLDVAIPESCIVAHEVLSDFADHPTANLLVQLEKAFAFCDKALSERGALLVHCASGVSRSVAVVVAYLMVKFSCTYEDALARVRVTRPCANPNLGFVKQLHILQDSHGDVQKALTRWSQEAGIDVMAHALRQRESANAKHAEIDRIENECMATLSAGKLDSAHKQVILRQLDSVQTDIDGLMSECDDRVARTILKAASQKTSRFLQELAS